MWKLELRPQAQGYGASPYPRCWAATTTHSSMLFQAFCQKMKIMGPTATHLAQFCAIQFPLQTLASCYCQGLKFCMDGRNTMLHAAKLRILPKNKILSPTAAYAAQFGVFQPHPWALPSCKLKGFKFCMHGRSAASEKNGDFATKHRL